MFLNMSVCPQGVYPSMQIPPPQADPPADTPREDTPGQTSPCALHAGRCGQQAGGTHPTGMQSCCS